MEWIVKIIGEDIKNQRIVVNYNPIDQSISFTGEYKTSGQWQKFTKVFHIDSNEPSIEEMQEVMEKVVVDLRIRIAEHENLDKGFSVIKEIELLTED